MIALLLLLAVAGAAVAMSGGDGEASSSSTFSQVSHLIGSDPPKSPLAANVIARWKAYANALGNHPAPGIGDYANAIDSARATMHDYLEGREEDRKKFESAVGTLFSPVAKSWAKDVIDTISSLGTPGGDPWDSAHLDQAMRCAESTLAEGWPLIGHSVNQLSNINYLSTQVIYCDTQQSMRDLPKVRGEALKLLWRQIALHSADPDVAFLTRFSLDALVEDPYSEAAHAAYRAVPFPKDEPGWIPAWAVMSAIVAARSKGVSADAVISATVLHMLTNVIRVDPATGYDFDIQTGSSTINGDAAWNMLSEVTRFAFDFVGWPGLR